MYALVTLLATAIEAVLTAAGRAIGRTRRNRTVTRAQELANMGEAEREAGAYRDDAPEASRLHGGHVGRLCAVSGRASPGSDEPIIAPLSGEPCAWYRITVHDRFRVWRPGPLGPTQVTRESLVAQHTSGWLPIRDDTGTAQVDPTGAEFELGEPSFATFAAGPAAAPEAITGMLPARPKHGAMTEGYRVQEWVIRGDEVVNVVGRLNTGMAGLVLEKPGRRPYLISTEGTGDASHIPRRGQFTT